MTSVGPQRLEPFDTVVVQHEGSNGNVEKRQALGDGARAGLGEHDDQISVTEMAERVCKANVASLRLHRGVAGDHAQSVGGPRTSGTASRAPLCLV